MLSQSRVWQRQMRPSLFQKPENWAGMRRLRTGLACLLALVGFFSFLYTLQQPPSHLRTPLGPARPEQSQEASVPEPSREPGGLAWIPCLVNGEQLPDGSGCLRDSGEDEIYLPFRGFLQSEFEISGFMEADESGRERFLWWANSSRVSRPPAQPYHVAGPFGPFASYNVEGRERVRCINGLTGYFLSPLPPGAQRQFKLSKLRRRNWVRPGLAARCFSSALLSPPAEAFHLRPHPRFSANCFHLLLLPSAFFPCPVFLPLSDRSG